MRKLICLLAMLAVLAAAGCSGNGETASGAGRVKLVVGTAASLQDAMEEAAAVYNSGQRGVEIVLTFASSGVLQKQIEEGAPVDVFISAGVAQVDALEQNNLLAPGSRRDLLRNELVLIAPVDSPLAGFSDLTGPGFDKIAVGTPETVPAGEYAREALASMGLWESLQPKLVLGRDVRQVLAYVETGNVDAGLVFRTDALTSHRVKVVAVVPVGAHKPIIYPIAVINDTAHPKEAGELVIFLTGQRAREIFVRHGFLPVEAADN